MLAVIRYAALGVLGYLTPRILVGAGVPLDEWAIRFGTWLGASEPWLREWGLTVISIAFALALSGIEVWWHPVLRTWRRLFRQRTGELESAPDTQSEPDLITRDKTTGKLYRRSGFTSTLTDSQSIGGNEEFVGWGPHLLERKKPTPNMAFMDALKYAVGDSHITIGNMSSGNMVAFFRGIRQAARLGEIFVWGRRGRITSIQNAPPLSLIPKEHWEYFGIDPLVIFSHDMGATVVTQANVRGDIYHDLWFDVDEVRGKWPKANISA